MFSFVRKRTLYTANVAEVGNVTPGMRRLTLVGGNLHSLPATKPAQWMKIFFPEALGQRGAARAYTIRHFDAATGAMTLDFALHGENGPASRWATRAKVGDTLKMEGPRSGHNIDPRADRYLLIGDATALPGIGAILEKLPDSVQSRAFIEVADRDEEQPLSARGGVNIKWVHSGKRAAGTSGQLEFAVRDATINTHNCCIWLAGESFMVRSIRTYLETERGIMRSAIDAKGYWKFGTAAHRE